VARRGRLARDGGAERTMTSRYGTPPAPDPDRPLRVLGVSGSPRGGSTDVLVRAALLGAEQVAGTEADFLPLAGRAIRGCDGCDPCLESGRCRFQDDMQPLYARLLRADVILLGTPVYFGAPSALLKAFLERVEGLGVQEKALRLKVGGSIATAACRNGGQETALQALHLWFLINDMLPVGLTSPVVGWGVAGSAMEATEVLEDMVNATNEAPPDADPALVRSFPPEISEHRYRLVRTVEVAWLYGRKLATVGILVRAGRAATGLDLPDLPYGGNLPAAFPPELVELRPGGPGRLGGRGVVDDR